MIFLLFPRPKRVRYSQRNVDNRSIVRLVGCKVNASHGLETRKIMGRDRIIKFHVYKYRVFGLIWLSNEKLGY